MNPAQRNHLHKLDAYRAALALYRCIGIITAHFPRGEAEFRNQMRRASRSVAFNIGEGVGKRGKARAASYQVALGETKELMVGLDCVAIDSYAEPCRIHKAQQPADRVAAMLTRLIESATPDVDT